MATIGDGIKIGIGLSLLKALPVVAVLGVGLCVLMDEEADKINARKAKATSSSKATNTISFKSGCNIRASPSTKAKKVGRVAPKQQVTVLAKQGRWRQISNGWVGCKAK